MLAGVTGNRQPNDWYDRPRLAYTTIRLTDQRCQQCSFLIFGYETRLHVRVYI
jgi:hypothetical protein